MNYGFSFGCLDITKSTRIKKEKMLQNDAFSGVIQGKRKQDKNKGKERGGKKVQYCFISRMSRGV